MICRWRFRESGLILDAMPADAAILGFDNRWQGVSIRTQSSERFRQAARSARRRRLISSRQSSTRLEGAGTMTTSAAAISQTSSL